MLQFSSGSWHARLYRRAFVNDRSWLDGFVEILPRPFDTNDANLRIASEAVRGAWEAYWNAPRRERRDRLSAIRAGEAARREAVAACERADHTWRLQSIGGHREAVRERFESGRLALCPYFWSVVLAVLVFVPIVLPLRWIIRRGEVAEAWMLAHRRVAVLATVLAVLVVSVIWTAPIVVERRQEIAFAIASAFQANEAAREAERQAIVEAQTAEEARREQEQALWRASHAVGSSVQPNEGREMFVSDVTGTFSLHDVGNIAKILGIVLVGTLAFMAAVNGLLALHALLARVADKAFDLVLVGIVILVIIPVENSWVGRALHGLDEGVSLVAAYARAVKERVCPFIVFAPDEREPSGQR